jgi:hypothetical protein
MMRFFALFVFAVSSLGAAMAEADRPVLVELFANQNCPACPKAHRTMAQMSEERDDIFILTWTVNYWDYLGDPDPMALPVAKDRQMAYTDRLSLRAPYTPQSFYDGAKECPGTRKRDIRRNISQRQDGRTEDAPQLSWDGEYVRVVDADATALELVMIEYLAGDANQTNMVNPVIKSESLGLWTTADDAFSVACETSCAILLQEQDVGEVIDVLPLN